MSLSYSIGRTFRRLRHAVIPGGLILVYHRVVELPSVNQSPLSVTTEAFASHLEVLRKHAYPMKLSAFIHALRAGTLPPRAVVVTFDDGYANNLFQAKPLLERFDIPATVFVTSGLLGTHREFWWDEVRRRFHTLDKLPPKLSVMIDGQLRTWDFRGSLADNRPVTRLGWLRNAHWRKARSRKNGAFASFQHYFKQACPESRRIILEELARLAGTFEHPRPNFRPLTADETAQLAEGDLVEIGAHTVTHSKLAALPPAAQQEEIRLSKLQLESIIGKPVTAFAYPFGSLRDYTPQTVALVRETGFRCACSNFRDVIYPGTDLFQLPRIPVRSWDGEELARRLWTRW